MPADSHSFVMADAPNISLTLHAQTDVGMVRSGNEDNFLVLDLTTGTSWTATDSSNKKPQTLPQGYYGSLLAVSDGMGGALAGEVASRLAVETVRDRMLQLQAHRTYGRLPFHERLRVAIEEANLLINGESLNNPDHKGLGATFTAAGILGNRVYFGQVGDSRAYLLRAGKILRITKDQSLVQQLIDAGQITEEEAETHSYRNVILQALGAHGNVNVEVNSLKVQEGDALVLCSDGLSGKVRADEIARLVQSATELTQACQSLIGLANERGGEDNITVLIVQFAGTGLPASIGDVVEPEVLERAGDTPTELQWGEGSDTEPLEPAGPTEKLPPAPPKATEPLSSGPTALFTPASTESKPPAATSERASRTDPRERDRRPTSVFSIGEFGEDEQVPKAFENPPAKPATAPTTSPVASPTADGKGPLKASAQEERKEVSVKARKGFINLLFMLVSVVVVAAIGLGAVWYLNAEEEKRKNEAAAIEEREQEYQQNERKKALIATLKDEIETVERDFRAARAPRDKEKWERLSDELQKVGAKFDKVQARPAKLLSEIEDDCREIEKALRKLRDDIKDLQGLLPGFKSRVDPVSC